MTFAQEAVDVQEGEPAPYDGVIVPASELDLLLEENERLKQTKEAYKRAYQKMSESAENSAEAATKMNEAANTMRQAYEFEKEATPYSSKDLWTAALGGSAVTTIVLGTVVVVFATQ